MPPRIMLNMIMKNEAVNLPRAFASVVGHVTSAVIVDTGSTDTSVEYTKAFFRKHGIECRVAHTKFVDFQQARNYALKCAQVSHFTADYILLMDADMELVVEQSLPPLHAECYALVQKMGHVSYHNARLLRKGSAAKYHGVTHEYLDVAQMPLLGDPWWFKDHASGSNRPEKYERDVRLLEGYLKDHPQDGRTLFYLAQTYRDKGDHEKAIEFYRKRVEVGGWDEEIFYSKICIARCLRALGREAEFVLAELDAYNARPSRAEPLFDLARHFREKPHDQHTSWLFANAGAAIKKPGDYLFVETYPYEVGFQEEKSIVGAYRPETRAAGFAACDWLSLNASAPEQVREGARRNLYWYLQPLKEIAPSFRSVQIPQVNPDLVYTNSNPSIILDGDQLLGVVRTVSYRIRPDGTYDYNGVSAIRTTNYLTWFGRDLKVQKSLELQRPTGFPEPKFTGVLDVEDMRLWKWGPALWVNGCVLEQNAEAWREQFTMQLNPDTGEVTLAGHVQPKFGAKANEKNWMPIGDGRFMYRPGVVIDHQGFIVCEHRSGLAVDQFSGGGQLQRFDGGWVAIIHEARPDPTNGKRYYQHRFVWFDHEFALQKVSRPFVFFDRQIEFAAGLVVTPDDTVIVSFGVLDREAWLGSLSGHDVRDLIWHS